MTWKFEHAIPHLGTITEGPAWNGHNLLFSNIAMNRVLQLNPVMEHWVLSPSIRKG